MTGSRYKFPAMSPRGVSSLVEVRCHGRKMTVNINMPNIFLELSKGNENWKKKKVEWMRLRFLLLKQIAIHGSLRQHKFIT